jgi:phosphoribosylformylglycinamidine synthase
MSGATAERVHVNKLIRGEKKLADYQIMAFPGGFSYGDDIASGKILANELKYRLGDDIKKFALAGKPIIGICNGFQVLVKMGLLPEPASFEQSTTLTFNDSDKFECRWVALKTERLKGAATKSLWTADLPDVIPLPVAHGEGKFVVAEKSELERIEANKQVVFRYVDDSGATDAYPANPNGAANGIAGICNGKGNVFGLMPHPERFVFNWQHPSRDGKMEGEHGWGLRIFQNAVNFVK